MSKKSKSISDSSEYTSNSAKSKSVLSQEGSTSSVIPHSTPGLVKTIKDNKSNKKKSSKSKSKEKNQKTIIDSDSHKSKNQNVKIKSSNKSGDSEKKSQQKLKNQKKEKNFKSSSSNSSNKKDKDKIHKDKRIKKKMETLVSKAVSLLHARSIGHKVNKIEATDGPIMVSSEQSILANGYVVQSGKIYQSDYSQVLPAKNKSKSDKLLVVKVLNLSECSPRFRTNLLQTSCRIIRYVSFQKRCKLFIKVYDLFLVSGAKLFVFMDYCNSARMMYDLVKSKGKQSPNEIRQWINQIMSGVDKLQNMGVAHRALKLEHILLNQQSNIKLVGWSKSVLYYEPRKKHILMQRKERRVRHNYHLPPEAFLGSYDPSKGDIWAAGVLLVTLCTKRYPFNVRDGKTKFSSQWREFTKKHELNTYVRNLCHKIFIIDPKRRITSKNILNDKYFKVSDSKLIQTNCSATDLEEIKEDSRVGGLSAVELVQDAEKGTMKHELVKTNRNKNQTNQDEANEDNSEEDYNKQETNDKSGVDVDATGYEGGSVGEELQEQVEDSQMAEIQAPEEAEGEAQPEDDEVGEETITNSESDDEKEK